MQRRRPSNSIVISEGFSFPEVVVSVSIVGMLAAFAIPRFTSLAHEARASEVVALGANLRSAAQLAHAQYVTGGANGSSATVRGKLVHLQNGYPDTGDQGIRSMVFDWEGFTATATTAALVFTRTGAPARDKCSVTYNDATPSNSATITNIDITGC